MKVTIYSPQALNEIGGRENNEDSIFPAKGEANEKNSLFLVCDGVGGFQKGEIASDLACRSVASYFKENPVDIVTPGYLAEVLEYVEEVFDQYFIEQPDAKGMATTLTLLTFHEAGATIAHCGDSRIYHLRAGVIIHKTKDHSYLNQMIDLGILSEEEAKNHPKKNVIVRAIQGKGVKRTKLDVEMITDIQPDDYFFLCTDGVLEKNTDDILKHILTKAGSDEDKIREIHESCYGKTHDNFSVYLLKVKSVEGTVPPEYNEVPVVVTEELIEEEQDDIAEEVKDIQTNDVPVPTPPQAKQYSPPPQDKKMPPSPPVQDAKAIDKRIWIGAFILVAIIVGVFSFYSNISWETSGDEKENSEAKGKAVKSGWTSFFNTDKKEKNTDKSEQPDNKPKPNEGNKLEIEEADTEDGGVLSLGANSASRDGERQPLGSVETGIPTEGNSPSVSEPETSNTDNIPTGQPEEEKEDSQ